MSRGEIIYGFAPGETQVGYIAATPALSDQPMSLFARAIEYRRTSEGSDDRVRILHAFYDGDVVELTVRNLRGPIRQDVFRNDLVTPLANFLVKRVGTLVVHEQPFIVEGTAPLFDQYAEQYAVQSDSTVAY